MQVGKADRDIGVLALVSRTDIEKGNQGSRDESAEIIREAIVETISPPEDRLDKV